VLPERYERVGSENSIQNLERATAASPPHSAERLRLSGGSSFLLRLRLNWEA
jgi:hypothetical protein